MKPAVFLLQSSLVSLTILISTLVYPGVTLAFQDTVDAIWNDTKRSSRGNCRNFVVQAGPPQVLKGKTSGRDCLGHAVRAYREGDHEKAFGWILAGQCHDGEARQALVRRAPQVMDYGMITYGPARCLESWGQAPRNTMAKARRERT